MKIMQKNKLNNINRVRVILNQKNNSQIFLLLINYCPFSGLYSRKSSFMEESAELTSRRSIDSVMVLISFSSTLASGRGSSEEKMQ